MQHSQQQIHTYVFPPGLLQRLRLLQPLGFFPKLPNVFLHFLVLAELLLYVVQDFPQEALATSAPTGRISHLR